MKTKSNVFNTPPATVFMLKTGVCVHFKDETVLRDIYIYIQSQHLLNYAFQSYYDLFQVN